MATKPKNVKLAKNGVDILNAIRNDASLSFQERVPVATQEDIKTTVLRFSIFRDWQMSSSMHW